MQIDPTDSRGKHILYTYKWVGVPQNGWFTMENPIKMDDLGGFPPIFGNTYCTNIVTNHLVYRGLLDLCLKMVGGIGFL